MYGYGVGSILLNNLACQGNEARLIDCRSGTVTSCSHSEDAGVRCHSQTSKNSLIMFDDKPLDSLYSKIAWMVT